MRWRKTAAGSEAGKIDANTMYLDENHHLKSKEERDHMFIERRTESSSGTRQPIDGNRAVGSWRKGRADAYGSVSSYMQRTATVSIGAVMNGTWRLSILAWNASSIGYFSDWCLFTRDETQAGMRQVRRRLRLGIASAYCSTGAVPRTRFQDGLEQVVLVVVRPRNLETSRADYECTRLGMISVAKYSNRGRLSAIDHYQGPRRRLETCKPVVR